MNALDPKPTRYESHAHGLTLITETDADGHLTYGFAAEYRGTACEGCLYITERRRVDGKLVTTFESFTPNAF